MSPTFTRRVAAIAAALLLALAPGAPAAAATGQETNPDVAADAAARYIRELSDTAIARLGAPDLEPAEREARARDLLERNFAGRDLGRFVLGRYWRVASEAQRTRFLELLREVALQRFLPTFQHLDPDQITVERAIADPRAEGLARVITRVDVPERAPVRLAWRVRPTGDGGHEIVDIMAEGVSMAITLRGEYASLIERNGGRVEALLTQLEERLASGPGPTWGQASD